MPKLSLTSQNWVRSDLKQQRYILLTLGSGGKRLKVFVVQDKLFRVWGKLFLEREDTASYFGRFEPMPDFVYLSAKFEEYEELLNQNRGEITQTGELNKWVVSLRPKLVSSEGEEVELIGAYVSFLERAPALTFHGNKMFIEDLNTLSGSND